jgi:hypothetical protein
MLLVVFILGLHEIATHKNMAIAYIIFYWDRDGETLSRTPQFYLRLPSFKLSELLQTTQCK